MNIFVTDENPAQAAKNLCDKHVVKMITESVQMLSSAMYSVGLNGPYKLSKKHENHPCTLWTRESIDNYQWLWAHAQHIGFQYTVRYGKIHKAHRILQDQVPLRLKGLPNIGRTTFVNCTKSFKHIDDTILAYRLCYIYDKGHFAKWRQGRIPEWFKECHDELGPKSR